MSDSVALQAWRHRARGIDDRRRPSAKAVFAAAVAVTLGGALLSRGALNAERTPAVENSRAQTPAATVGRSPCPAVAAVLHADVDGDGCEEAVSFADGVLTAGPLRMRVGAAGDQIALGRWTCGTATVALLRPVTGEVFRFDGWATPGDAMPAATVGRVDGAVGLHGSARDGGRCDDIVVTRRSGPPVLLPERPVAG